MPHEISLALSSRGDNHHHHAATAKIARLIVAAFPSRLSRYTRVTLSPSKAPVDNLARGQFLVSPRGQFFMSPDTVDRTKREHFIDSVLGPWHEVILLRWCRRRRGRLLPCPSEHPSLAPAPSGHLARASLLRIL